MGVGLENAMKLNVLICALAIDLDFESGWFVRTSVRTRQMVNYVYAWKGQGDRILWCKLLQILTCESFVKLLFGTEGLTEPPSNWFSPKFHSIKLEFKIFLKKGECSVESGTCCF